MSITSRKIIKTNWYAAPILLIFLHANVFSAQVNKVESIKIDHWTGVYAGINGGYAWANVNTKIRPLPDPLPADRSSIQPAILSLSMKSGVLGSQLGYNYQLNVYPKILLGIETDMNWIPLKGSAYGNAIGNGVSTGRIFTHALSTQQQMTWFGTLRPRLGYLPFNSILIYATGGLAYGNVKATGNTNLKASYSASLNQVRSGWTVGGGIEWIPAQHWSTKIEYLYYNLGEVSAIANPSFYHPPYQKQYIWSRDSQMIRIGINYRFNI